MIKFKTQTINRNTYDIINAIRNEASESYREAINKIDNGDLTALLKVGDVLYGNPGLANEFLTALINRIALVNIQNLNFSNPYSGLKKGLLEYGETVEDAFLEMTQARDFSKAKADKREYQRTIPKLKTAFYTKNYAAQYPATIDQDQLKRAFLSEEGVNELIDRITASLTTAAEYDEYLLFKYLLIKAITKGKMKPIKITDVNNVKDVAIKLRSLSNQLTFPSSDYNAAKVKTATPKNKQIIFMDSEYAAKYDVELLASSFNMDKADFEQNLYLIDDWASFDNDRFDVIRQETEGMDEITAEELKLMKGVIGVVVDSEFFQVYDNLMRMTSNYSAAGLYTNFFLTTEKTVAVSPFSNAVVLTDASIVKDPPASIKVSIKEYKKGLGTEAVTLEAEDLTGLRNSDVLFLQTEDAINKKLLITSYGVITGQKIQAVDLELTSGDVKYELKAADITQGTGTVLTFTKKK